MLHFLLAKYNFLILSFDFAVKCGPDIILDSFHVLKLICFFLKRIIMAVCRDVLV